MDLLNSHNFKVAISLRTHVCGFRHPTADLRWRIIFQPSQFSVGIHLNSLVIKKSLSQIGRQMSQIGVGYM